jgi:hypothetical protein
MIVRGMMLKLIKNQEYGRNWNERHDLGAENAQLRLDNRQNGRRGLILIDPPNCGVSNTGR